MSRVSLEEARALWPALDIREPGVPFLTYAWFDCLRQAAGGRVRAEPVQVTGPAGQAAFAALYRRRALRSRVIPVRVVHLNETGDASYDRLTLEHNGLAGQAGRGPQALHELLRDLLQQDPGWDEFSLGWLAATRWTGLEPALEGLDLRPVVADRKAFHYVDLQGMSGPDDYLAGLSRNTRYQIRRAMRGYGGEAALKVEPAASVEQALEWFRAMVNWHQAEWNARGKPGAFSDRFMRDFHECLIARGTTDGLAQVLRVQGADGPVGYLYNLAAGDYVCNYQSGFRYRDDPKLKPGLVCHALAIGRAAALGFARYDFLMGDSQYKRSLGNGQGEMVQVRLQRPRWRFRLERVLRRLVRR
ncbi:GNAT family N-acetyltransferase [Thioalkalivibrio sp. ALJT]|uniref:GNAT family N-acetyltransferase n=1 Tax=Thioalkalivibrio sp. ALJT TaxID=1158146 RepID=UPI0003758B15|nr:GNAT family N-acetyltransferase [Thioalkalivibrio sp. ALJT]